MAFPTRRREAATSRPPAVRLPFREPDELPGVRRDDMTVEFAQLAELAVRAVRVPEREQPRPSRVVGQAREA